MPSLKPAVLVQSSPGFPDGVISGAWTGMGKFIVYDWFQDF